MRIPAVLLAAIVLGAGGIAAAGEHDHHHMPQPSAALDSSAEEVAIRVPDVQVTTHDGRKVGFLRDLVKGKLVAVNFIYTTCSAICSPMTANMREVQRQLDPALADRVHFISITIDPKVDTPQVLNTFAGQFKIEKNWTFVTASPKNLAQLQKGFAVSMARKEDHTPLVMIGNDATGKWTRKYGLARPEAIVRAIRATAGLPDPEAAP